MKRKPKLELTWIGKENRPKLEPRILIEDPDKSYHAKLRISGNDIFNNILIHGDNLLALKALEQEYTGKVKFIYIDPPYNTGNAFEHYDDGVEHSLWLSLLYERLLLLHRLLSKDGVFFVNIDETEHAYLKIMLDEIFRRENFLGDLIWRKRKGGGNDSRFLALDHDYIIVFAKNADKNIHKAKWRVSQTEKYLRRYKEIEDDGTRYYWDTLARDGLQNPIPVEIECPDGTILKINSQKSEATIKEGLKNGKIRLTRTKNGWTLHHKVYMPKGQVLRSILLDFGTNKEAGDEIKKLFGGTLAFDYPKPEKLIKGLLELCTKPGDLILDSFLGSGTTAAAAHKMGRRWIGIELGDHCRTHCLPRLKKVINNKDPGGVTKTVGWKGGGGFRYYHLGPSLIVNDEWNNPVINPDFNASMLAEAMCKLEGFEYAPSDDLYWIHGQSTETDFIYVTTQFMSKDMLTKIGDEVGPNRSLLICCSAFRCDPSRFPNLTIKKIPKAVMKKCEWGHDDYSLEIKNLPQAPPEPEDRREAVPAKPRRKFGKGKTAQLTLFDMGGDQ